MCAHTHTQTHRRVIILPIRQCQCFCHFFLLLPFLLLSLRNISKGLCRSAHNSMTLGQLVRQQRVSVPCQSSLLSALLCKRCVRLCVYVFVCMCFDVSHFLLCFYVCRIGFAKVFDALFIVSTCVNEFVDRTFSCRKCPSEVVILYKRKC